MNNASAAAAAPLRAGQSIEANVFAGIRRKLIVGHCKWDPQVGDASTLAPFPLFLQDSHWKKLSQWAEQLTAEAMAAESEMLQRPVLQRRLGIPRAICRALAAGRDCDSFTARLMRFDFHWTSNGWVVSEVNADVPGGLTEAGAFTQMMSEHISFAKPSGDPAAVWADAITRVAQGNDVALLSAAGFMEDHQVIAYLALLLRQRGVPCHLASCDNLQWVDGVASLHPNFRANSLGAVVRFVQAEWLVRTTQWRDFFTHPHTPVLNAATSILIESKRFPCIWDDLSSDLRTWRALLPQTIDVQRVSRNDEANWVFKTAFCNTGDSVLAKDWVSARHWRSARRDRWLWPGNWLAQRRFEIVPVDTPAGLRFPCLGIYTVAGRAVGIYGRLSQHPVVNYAATDVAVLIETQSRGDRFSQ